MGLANVYQNPDARRFAKLMFLVGFGVETSRVAQTTFFLQSAGADQLPLVFVAFAVAMACASSIYASAALKMPLATLASIATGAAAALISTAWILILMGVRNAVLAYSFYCVVEMCFIFLPLTLWAVANQAFSAEDAERYLPPIAAFGLMGAVTGGLITRSAVAFIGPYNTLPLAVAGYCVCVFLTRQIPPPEHRTMMSARVLRERPAFSEPVVATLVYISIPLFFLAYVIEFMYYTTIGQVVASATDQSQFISTFGIFCSITAVVAQVWLTPLLFRRIGVGTTAFIYPSALALGSFLALVYALYLGNRGPGAGAPTILFALFVLCARALDIVLYQSVYDSTTNILYYAVPARTRTKARSLVGGIMFPASVACSGLLLLSFKYFEQPMYNVAFTAVAVGFLVMVMAMDIRPDYLRSLLANSDRGNVKARRALMDEIARLSLSESRVLLLESLQTDREDEALFAVEKLLDTYDHFLLEDLQEIKQRIQPSVMAALAKAMEARGISAEERLLLA